MSDDEVIDLEIEDDDLEVIENEDPTEQAASGNEGEEANVGEDDTNKKVVKPKRVIRNPQPKLNAETLKGKRGITALESYFERVKYKGRGYEEQDLGVILKTYEYWCHRLFPKLPFDQCIAKIESLGTKRPIITHLKRIRMNMLVDDCVPTSNELMDDGDEGLSDDEFNELLPQSLPRTQALPVVQPPVDLSEEQLERIRLNKERAEKIRREKLLQKKIVVQDDSQIIQNEESFHQTMAEMDPSDFLIESQVSQVHNTDDTNSQSSSQLKEISSQASSDLINDEASNETLIEPRVNEMEMSESQVESPVTENMETAVKETPKFSNTTMDSNSVEHILNDEENENMKSDKEDIEIPSDSSQDKLSILEERVVEQMEYQEESFHFGESFVDTNNGKEAAHSKSTKNASKIQDSSQSFRANVELGSSYNLVDNVKPVPASSMAVD